MFIHRLTRYSVIIKKAFRIIISSLSLLTLCHCSTAPSTPVKKELPRSRTSYSNDYDTRNSYNDIDINALVRELQMNSPFSQVGYVEKSFNSCQIKSNRSKKPLCRRLYLGKVNYHILCRRSTGTVQRVTLRPMNQSQMRWKRGPTKGYTTTNSQGFGSIHFIANRSSKNLPLYLYLGRKVARKTLKDKWKLVLPNSWCL